MSNTIVNNIPHSTYKTEESWDGLTITVTADDGYKLVTTPAPTYTYFVGGSETTESFYHVSETEASMRYSISPDNNTTITLNGQTTGGEQPTANVINNITGEGNSETHSVVGSVVSIEVTATNRNNTFFNLIATYTGADGTEQTAEFSVDGRTASVSISDADLSQPITLTGLCAHGITITNNLTNCSVEGLKDIYSPQETLTINLTANDGFIFSKTDNTPKLYGDSWGGEVSQDFEFEEGATTATLVYDLSLMAEQDVDAATLQGGAIAGEPPVVGENYGSINVYVVTTDELDEFAQIRFYEQQDTGNFVNRIKRIFATVPTAGDTTIQCGNTATSVHALTPAKQVLTLDFGAVTIPAHNENSTDFDAEIRLFVPFHGFVDIPAEYAGKPVNLVCLVDIITGKGVAKLTCDGIMFDAYDIEPSQDVIYRTLTQQINVIGGEASDNSVLYGVEPYVHCKWYTSQPAGQGAVQKVSKIGDLTGFNVLTDITPIHTGEMLSDEQETIYSLLQQGIYVE